MLKEKTNEMRSEENIVMKMRKFLKTLDKIST